MALGTTGAETYKIAGAPEATSKGNVEASQSRDSSVMANGQDFYAELKKQAAELKAKKQ